MNTEIEIKAWVDDPDHVRTGLTDRFGAPLPVHKKDVYYTADGKFPDLTTIRLRESGGKWVLTYKDKRVESGMEINREHETVVDDFAVMDELLTRFGCRRFLEKEKIGSLFSSSGLTIELVEVKGLGTFLEVEKVVAAEGVDSEGVRREILAVFDQVGVSQDNIEPRYYTQLLRGT